MKGNCIMATQPAIYIGDIIPLILPDGTVLRLEQTNDDFTVLQGDYIVAKRATSAAAKESDGYHKCSNCDFPSIVVNDQGLCPACEEQEQRNAILDAQHDEWQAQQDETPQLPPVPDPVCPPDARNLMTRGKNYRYVSVMVEDELEVDLWDENGKYLGGSRESASVSSQIAWILDQREEDARLAAEYAEEQRLNRGE
jgi:hypothetical protein